MAPSSEWRSAALLLFWGDCEAKLSLLCVSHEIILFFSVVYWIYLPASVATILPLLDWRKCMMDVQQVVWGSKRRNVTLRKMKTQWWQVPPRQTNPKIPEFMKYVLVAVYPRSAYNIYKRGKYSEDPLPSVTSTEPSWINKFQTEEQWTDSVHHTL